MRKILSTAEIVQDLNLEVEPKELCATAEADYDETKSTLVIKLDSFVRQVRHAGPDVCTHPDWLPKAEILREGVGSDEASDLARDIFRRWTKKVRESATTQKAVT
jgi:hypothetical protein